jgi:hypothetical protein
MEKRGRVQKWLDNRRAHRRELEVAHHDEDVSLQAIGLIVLVGLVLAILGGIALAWGLLTILANLFS